MQPINIDLEVRRGDTKRHSFLIKDKATNSAMDISAWTNITMTIDPESAPTDATGNVETMVGVLTTDGTDGRFYCIPSGTIPAETYNYDVQVNDNNNEKCTILYGKYKIKQDITKS